MVRVVSSIVLQVVVATLLTLALGLLYFLVIQFPIAEAFSLAVSSVLIFIDIGIATWAVLLFFGAVRERGIGWGFGGSLLAALVGFGVNLVWIVILSAINGGVDAAAILLGVQAGVFFLIAVALATLLVRRVLPITTEDADAPPRG